ncbi:hypothetical protein [Paenibacillus sp. A3]|uniref:hypothetical protein n=1 Tax=Paenibacillus sp. A3 TaxID=1337054 RepID=UPI000B1CB952|nr:hypothetical protein [Paenibacillus sp. A3]
MKVSLEDLKNLERDGKVKIHTPELVEQIMKSSEDKKIKKDGKNVRNIMEKMDKF